mmetsp:Transcript_44838/g.108357  ORF Transcript_44838/g.108357 Transcript_44838/m.108357 type:complete len:90 (+) Transcript_44838:2179-2448(+)
MAKFLTPNLFRRYKIAGTEVPASDGMVLPNRGKDLGSSNLELVDIGDICGKPFKLDIVADGIETADRAAPRKAHGTRSIPGCLEISVIT